MKIQLNDDLRITTDAYNFILQTRRITPEYNSKGERNKNPGESWHSEKFYPLSQRGLRWLVENLLIALTDAANPQSLGEVDEQAIEAARKLQKALSPIVKIDVGKLEKAA